MLYTIQWVNVPDGASGSSKIRAKLLVPAGTFSHEIPGVRYDPAQVNSFGRTDPGVIDSTVMVKFVVAGVTCAGMVVVTGEAGESPDVLTGAVQPQVSTSITIVILQRTRMLFISGISPG